MRATRLQFTGIVSDDRAAALTEFAIVVPVVLLFFLAMSSLSVARAVFRVWQPGF